MQYRRGQGSEQPDAPTPRLEVRPEAVCAIAFKAREFAAKDVVTERDPGSNPADDRGVAVLEDHGDDPAAYEVASFISSLSEDAQVDLVALAWLGRGDYTVRDWPEVRREAAAAHNKHTARYLLGMPLLSEHLEQGLSLLGHSCQELEIDEFY